MAPTAPTAPSPTGFAGDEFSNNLFSDLAPLLTLFGEQVTKQFLSLSMGWADNILVAMAPLGILTIIVSAIRVGGVKALKAIVGRARESKSTAEQELLSSTSQSVCEMWSGQEVVRVLGQPKMKEMIILNGSRSGMPLVLGVVEAVEKGIYRSAKYRNVSAERLATEAPNITLNIEGSVASAKKLWAFALFGVILQGAVLTVSALAVYQWHWLKGGKDVATYGYPCFLAGTTSVIAGVLICSHIIEGSTTEESFICVDGSVSPQVLRLQRSCTVSEQHFDSFLISNSESDTVIRTSRINDKDYSAIGAVGTGLSVVGFICQFVGLRALHWSATILQLGATLIMTGVRSWVRRGLAKNPHAVPIPEGHELSALTFSHEGLRSWEVLCGLYNPDESSNFTRRRRRRRTFAAVVPGELIRPSIFLSRRLSDGLGDRIGFEDDYVRILRGICNTRPEARSEDSATEFRRELQKIMPDAESSTTGLADSLGTAMENILAILAIIKGNRDIAMGDMLDGNGHFLWLIDIIERRQHNRNISNNPRLSRFTLSLSVSAELGDVEDDNDAEEVKNTVSFKVDRGLLNAILSLWLLTLRNRAEAEDKERDAAESAADSDARHRIEREGLAFRAPEQMAYLRVVAGRPHASVEIGRWLGRAVEILPAATPDGDHVTPSSPLWMDSPDSPECKPWPVFGLLYSSLVDADPPMMAQHYRPRDRPTEAALISTASLEQNCAMDIFATFFLQVASHIRQIGGTTRRLAIRPGRGPDQGLDVERVLAPAPSDDRLEEPEVWTNTVCAAMANAVAQSGLTDLAGAYTLIIPALYRYQLLPASLGSVHLDPTHRAGTSPVSKEQQIPPTAVPEAVARGSGQTSGGDPLPDYQACGGPTPGERFTTGQNEEIDDIQLSGDPRRPTTKWTLPGSPEPAGASSVEGPSRHQEKASET